MIRDLPKYVLDARRVGLMVLTVVSVMVGNGLRIEAAVSGQPQCFGKSATIVGTRGHDYLRGTPGRDVIVGRGGYDAIMGREGNDLICSGRGADGIRGGAGRDKIRAGPDPGDETVDGGPGADIIVGGRGYDSIGGGLGDDLIRGGPRKDDIYGGRGNDRLWAGAGDDLLAGGPGNDSFNGGRGGSDLAHYLSTPAALTVNLAEGTATGQGEDSLAQVEDVLGSQYDGSLTGNGRHNELHGGFRGDDSCSALRVTTY